MKRPHTFRFTLLIMAASLLAACSGGQPPAPAPAAEVGVVTASPVSLPLVSELPGRVEASRIAEVRARAAGIVLKRVFDEGVDVQVGQHLFTIDPAPLRAAYNSAAASLVRAQASLKLASLKAERYAPLVETSAISRQEYDDTVAARDLAQADVALYQAAVDTARLNLGYATVTAPISGRIGRALVTEGALVGQTDATQLAIIQQIDPVYVNFTQPVADVLKLRRAVEAGQLGMPGDKAEVPVRVLLDGGGEYPHPGRLLFSDLTVDSSTGQVTLRAEVPNPQGRLLPGLYVRVQIEQAQAENAILLPQQAVTRTAQGDVVSVVDTEGQVSSRKVTISGAKDGQWMVLAGLKAGEQVMVDGFQHVKPGEPVNAVPWTGDGKQKTAMSGAATAVARH